MSVFKQTGQRTAWKDTQRPRLPEVPGRPLYIWSSRQEACKQAPPEGAPLEHHLHAWPTLIKPTKHRSAFYYHRAPATLKMSEVKGADCRPALCPHPREATGVNKLCERGSAAEMNPGRLLGGSARGGEGCSRQSLVLGAFGHREEIGCQE